MKVKPIKQLTFLMRHAHNPECSRTLARWWWYTLLGAGVLAVISVLVYGTWAFLVKDAQVSANPQTIEAQTLSREELSTTLEAFEQRTVRYEHLKRNPVQVVDPSVE